MRKIFSAIIIVAMVCSFFAPAFAAATNGTWLNTGAADANWSTTTNWVGTPGTPAGDGAGDTGVATFNTSVGTFGTSGTPILIDTDTRNIGGIAFDTAAGNYTIGTTGGNPLLVAFGGTTQILSTLTATNAIETINAPLTLGGNNYTLSNNSVNGTVAGAGTLIIGGNITTGAGLVALNLSGSNTNANTISGNISQIGGGDSVAINKSDAGTWVLSGANTYTGGTTLNAGTLNINSAGALGAAAGTFLINGGTIDNTSGAAITLGVVKNQTWAGDFAFTGTGGAIGTLDMGTGAIGITPGATRTITTATAGSVLIEGGAITGAGANIIHVGTAATSALALNGAIGTGAGSVTNTSGTLSLAGNNTYTGGTILTAGTLNINSDTALGATAGTFVINGGTIDNTDIGGTHTLANNNAQNWNNNFAFTGTHNLNLGTGAVTLGATPTITVTANTLTEGGIIGGAFGLIKAGAGTLVLSGQNTYTGATTVNAGTLQLGDSGVIPNSSAVTITGTLDMNAKGEAVGSITGSGTITNNAFGQSVLESGRDNSSTTFSGLIKDNTAVTKTVALSKSGTGTLTLSTANTYSGGTTIAGGTLKISNGTALGTGAVTNNATLDVGTTSLALGSTYTQGAGSLNLTANSSSNFGNIASGAATFTGSNTINVTVGGYIANGTTLTIINTGGSGITGSAPATVTSSNSFVTFSGAISGTNVVITANRSGSNSFSGVASNSNGSAVGGVLDNIASPSSDMATVLNALSSSSTSQVASSEDSMTPTNDGAITQASTAMLNNFVNNMETHLRNTHISGGGTGISAGDDYINGVDIWAQGLGDYAHQDPRGSSNGYNATSWGISGGLDKSLCNESIRLGLGSGYGQTFVRSKDFSGKTDIDSIPGTIYCDYENSNLPFYINAAFTFIYNMYTGSREVTAGPTITRTANADYNGQQYSGYIETGYSFFYKKLSLTPLASFQYMHLHTGSYDETGAGALDLSVASQDYDMAQTGIGAKLACPFEQKYGTLTPDLHFKWLYDWVGDSQATTAGFTGGGTSFGTNGFSPAQSAYDFGIKLSYKTKYNITIGLDYDFLFKQDYYEHYGTVDVRYSF